MGVIDPKLKTNEVFWVQFGVNRVKLFLFKLVLPIKYNYFVLMYM